ncbi:AAA family ATPase [Embleya hyalina]
MAPAATRSEPAAPKAAADAVDVDVDVRRYNSAEERGFSRLADRRRDHEGAVRGRGCGLAGDLHRAAGDLLYPETVDAECAEADRESGAEPGACRALLDRIAPGIDGAVHPRGVSEGQRPALVPAIRLVAAPHVVLLDEPTRGLDHRAKLRFVRVVRELADAGRVIVLATHDVEFVAQVADRVVVMAERDLIADGPTAEVVVSSLAFAPQVAKTSALRGG